MKKRKILKTLFFSILVFFYLTGFYAKNPATCAFAFSEDLAGMQSADLYYEKGMAYLKSGQYEQAIVELFISLKQNPDNTAVRNNLSVAYSSRGTYLFNQGTDLENASNDFRSALYYLKYYNSGSISPDIEENIKTAEQNLINVLVALKESTSPESRFKKAKELRGQGNFIQAVVEYHAAVEKPELRADSFEALGDIMKTLQMDFNAAEYYDKALAQNPDNSTVHLKFARILSKLGNMNAAVQEYNLALANKDNYGEVLPILENFWKEKIKETPGNAALHMNLGAIYQKKDEYDTALTEYSIAESLDPGNPVIRLNLATLFQAKGDYSSAIRAYDTILEVYPDNNLARYYRADALKKAGMAKEAINELQKILIAEPQNQKIKNELFETIRLFLPANESLPVLQSLAINNPTDFTAQYNYGYILHSNKYYDNALSFYNKALALDPKYIDTYINTASIYMEKQMNTEATAVLKKALSIEPENKNLKNLLSQLNNAEAIAKYEQAAKKYKEGNYKGALEDYLSIKTPDADVYVGIGACYQALNQPDNAVSSYQKALVGNENDKNILFYLGGAYYDKKDYVKAEEYYNKAKVSDPNNIEINQALKALKQAKSNELLDKGLDLYNSKKYTDAVNLFTKIITADPENAYAYYYRALTYDGLKKYWSAIPDYKKATANSNDLNVAYYSLGIDYDLVNNPVEAKKAYQKFVELSAGKEDEYVKYAKSRLLQLK
jgi:superkiller protein 3